MSVSIYTDGSALAKSDHPSYGCGGFGIVFMVNGVVKKTVSRGFRYTKTGRMELSAVLNALKILDKDQKATFYCDSQYVIHCFTKNWLTSWENQCWPDRIKNIDLLQKLLSEYRKFIHGNIQFVHVKGHQDNEGNCLADKLASYKNFTVFEKDLDLSEMI